MGRKRKMENRDAILRASYRLFITRGYEIVSMQDIEKESNVHVRSFYRYFKNKDEILGALIEDVEKKMLEYLQPVLTDNPLLTFVLFSIMKLEYATLNPDYFRMRASLIARPDTFLKSFMDIYALSYPQTPDWRSDEHTMLQGLYVLGGALMVQYGFIKNISGTILPEESADFIKDYDHYALSEQTINSFRRFMEYAIRNNLHILKLPDDDVDNIMAEAVARFSQIDINGFRRYYEEALIVYNS